MRRPQSHRQKYRIYNATMEQLEARYQCKTCTDVIEHDAEIYCRTRRTYWEDVANGLYDDTCGAKRCRDLGCFGMCESADATSSVTSQHETMDAT